MKGRGLKSMYRTKSPCFGCKKRNETCRPACEEWKKYEEIHKKERAEIYKKKREYNLGFGAPYRSESKFKNKNASGYTTVRMQRHEQKLKERMNLNEER